MDLVEQCLAAEFKFESVLQARFPVLKGPGAEATDVQVNMHLKCLHGIFSFTSCVHPIASFSRKQRLSMNE
jgi:hypothetical protein